MDRLLRSLALASVLLATSAGATAAVPAASGDTLLIQRVQEEPGNLPARGLRMADVEARYGAPAERLQRICQAVAQWPTYAREVGVPAVEIERISQFQPAWTRSFA